MAKEQQPCILLKSNIYHWRQADVILFSARSAALRETNAFSFFSTYLRLNHRFLLSVLISVYPWLTGFLFRSVRVRRCSNGSMEMHDMRLGL